MVNAAKDAFGRCCFETDRVLENRWNLRSIFDLTNDFVKTKDDVF